jgi:hypothetical protein
MKTTYKVMAATGFRGHKQGEEFEAELPEAVERRAKERGSIRAVKKNDKKEDKSDG